MPPNSPEGLCAKCLLQAVLLDPLAQGTIDRQLVQWKALDLPEVKAAEEPTADEPVEAAEEAEGSE